MGVSEEVHVAHNSYLQIWAECGTLAFILYLILVIGSFWDLRRIRKIAANRYYSSWILNYSAMFEASLGAFVVASGGCNVVVVTAYSAWLHRSG